MSRWTPCKHRDLVRKLRALGFAGPYSGTRHQFMTMGAARLAIPSSEEIGVAKVREMVREIELLVGRAIDVDEWDRLP